MSVLRNAQFRPATTISRKYDKNRHTLTHYKGVMVCGFGPGSGSTGETSFNRADVFKRHLTSVHGVEQTNPPPNARKKTSDNINSTKTLSGYAPDARGKCSTCSVSFSSAQNFYEHLDDCMLRIVQQEDSSEAINAARLAEVERDPDVEKTLRRNHLPIATANSHDVDKDEDADGDDDDDQDEEDIDDKNDDDFTFRSSTRRNKSRGHTHSKGGMILSKGQRKRKDYPSSWGCSTPQIKTKKRVLNVFDGRHRLRKDDLMPDSGYEVRMKTTEEKAHVTDLDLQTMRRADVFDASSMTDKGPWIADNLTEMDLRKLVEVGKE